jgi:predicted RNA-binding Zn ribbon-like protein
MDSPAIDFLNSDLADPDAPERLARSVGCDPRHAPDPGDLLALRELLRSVAGTITDGDVPSKAQFSALNDVLSGAPVRPSIFHDGSRYGLEMTPTEPGPAACLAELAGHFVRLVARLQPPRLKLCAACGRAFYDESKNRTRRWCDARTCGNRARVRRFRAAHRR